MTKLRISQIIMAIAALSALSAGVGAFANVSDATDATKIVETWRLVGFFTFAALFALLAAKPKTDKAIWMIVVLNKLALTVAGALFAAQGTAVAGVSDVLIFDGGLTLLIVGAYVLSHSDKSKAKA